MKWKKLREEIAYKGHRQIIKKHFLLPNGKEADFDVFVEKEEHAVVVLALTPDHQVILCRQFMPGVEEVRYKLPGGMLERAESVQETAERELIEETGYSGEVKILATTLESPYQITKLHSCVAVNCKRSTEQRLDAEEFIEVVLMPLEEFKKRVRAGEILDTTVSMLGLDYLKLL